MEISRPFKPIFVIPSVDAGASKDTAQTRSLKAGGHNGEALPLEKMQQALSAMPDVDTAKVAAIKLALQRGEISTDPVELASSMLAYHRGSDM